MFASVVAVHLLLLLFVLRDRDAGPAMVAATTLSVFDVRLPPPDPPPPPLPMLPPDPVSVSRPADVSPPGGSFGRSERAPAPQAPGVRAAPDTTETVAAPPAPPARIGIGTADDLTGPGAAGTIGVSAGSGDGAGSGRGDGEGAGSGGGGGWRRAAWIVKPSAAAVSRVYPAKARKGRRSGIAYLACVVPRPGPATSCRPILDRPRGEGFAEAAMQLWPQFRIKPLNSGKGDHPEIPVIVPIAFFHGQDADRAVRAQAAAISAAEALPVPPQP